MSALKKLQGKRGLGKAAQQMDVPATKRQKSSHALQPADAFADMLDDNKRKQLRAITTNGVPTKSASKVNETSAVITADVNGVHEEDDVSSEEQDIEDEMETTETNGVVAVPEDVEMVNGDAESEENEELSFGDMLRARHPDAIDINAQLADVQAGSAHLVPASGKNALAQPVTGNSMATVLQQALKTNDKEMLESCFRMREPQAVRNTISRLPSPLISTLLARISERVYRRPGRIGAFMTWIQWCLVAHGGYLATQPETTRKLKSLNQVLKQRAQGLLPLVQLKGKLDLLSAQLELRRTTEDQRQRADATGMDNGVLYVEGPADEDWPENEEEPLAIEAKSSDDEIDEDDEEDEGDLLDIEAEETDDDEGEDDEDDSEQESDSASDPEEDDLDDDDDSEESEVQIKTARPDKLSRKR